MARSRRCLCQRALGRLRAGLTRAAALLALSAPERYLRRLVIR
jgi:hypothetical protein